MQISVAWEGKSICEFLARLCANIIIRRRTMIWAIDLDDGSLLEALTSVSTKKKEEVLAESDFDMPDFGTNWDFVPKEANGKRKRDEL